ncbi:hypothetical protein MRB53_023298 [Persea americana]|uniref:Uncharacterized protein n=1 Tax=Persea americana TaxID=3435 RepID=A0ACC2L9N8_PERAE|nr:hypothetical protein MRB53_023298 [Persea americana]
MSSLFISPASPQIGKLIRRHVGLSISVTTEPFSRGMSYGKGLSAIHVVIHCICLIDPFAELGKVVL